VLQAWVDNFSISLLFTVELNKDQEITNELYPRANGSFLVASKNKPSFVKATLRGRAIVVKNNTSGFCLHAGFFLQA